jgi:hypothetical protein
LPCVEEKNTTELLKLREDILYGRGKLSHDQRGSKRDLICLGLVLHEMKKLGRGRKASFDFYCNFRMGMGSMKRRHRRSNWMPAY